MKKCPVKGCTRKWRKRSGLEAHLFEHHLKHEIIKAFLDVLEI